MCYLCVAYLWKTHHPLLPAVELCTEQYAPEVALFSLSLQNPHPAEGRKSTLGACHTALERMQAKPAHCMGVTPVGPFWQTPNERGRERESRPSALPKSDLENNNHIITSDISNMALCIMLSLINLCIAKLPANDSCPRFGFAYDLRRWNA